MGVCQSKQNPNKINSDPGTPTNKNINNNKKNSHLERSPQLNDRFSNLNEAENKNKIAKNPSNNYSEIQPISHKNVNDPSLKDTGLSQVYSDYYKYQSAIFHEKLDKEKGDTSENHVLLPSKFGSGKRVNNIDNNSPCFGLREGNVDSDEIRLGVKIITSLYQLIKSILNNFIKLKFF